MATDGMKGQSGTSSAGVDRPDLLASVCRRKSCALRPGAAVDHTSDKPTSEKIDARERPLSQRVQCGGAQVERRGGDRSRPSAWPKATS